MHCTPRLSANTRACGLMRVATSTPRVGASAVEIESLLVAEQLLDPGDLADALHLDHDGLSVAVAAEQIDGPDVGRVLTPHDLEVVTQGTDARRDELLELGLDAVLGQAGVIAECQGVVEHDIVQLDCETLTARIGGDDGAWLLPDRARWAHPVERLVRLRIGVHGDRAVSLEQDEPLRGRKPGTEPAFVLDRAPRHDQSHSAALYHTR
jgi:hypothetical protein